MFNQKDCSKNVPIVWQLSQNNIPFSLLSSSNYFDHNNIWPDLALVNMPSYSLNLMLGLNIHWNKLYIICQITL